MWTTTVCSEEVGGTAAGFKDAGLTPGGLWTGVWGEKLRQSSE